MKSPAPPGPTQSGLRGSRPDPPAIPLRSLRLLGEVHRREFEYVELRRALRPGDHQPPFERPDPLDHSGHVALGIVAISERLILAAERQAAEEDQAVGIVILP